MYDTGKILGGLAAFVVVVSVPFWFSAATGTPDRRPQLEIPKGAGLDKCIYPAAEMREKHMDLLNDWRNEYVRDSKLFVEGRTWPDGKKMMRSLSNTCIRCHSNKDKFCDECHAFAGAEPYCWACHVIPKEGK